MTELLTELADGGRELVGSIEFDLGTLVRVVIAVIVAVVLLRILVRVAGIVLRVVAVILIALVILAILTGTPTRLSDIGSLPDAAIEAVHDIIDNIIDRSLGRDLPPVADPLPEGNDAPPESLHD